MKGELVSDKPGNTPLKDVPVDYYPKGCGYWFEIPEGLDAGKKMFFRDSVHGKKEEPDKTIVFVHGNPENSYIYRKVIEELKRQSSSSYRVVAMDHIGFGLSDRAGFEMVSMDHAANLLHLIKYLDVKNVTMIIHDWGGPIGIGAFLQEPERLSNLIITNTTVFPIPRAGLNYTNYPIKHLPWSFYPNMIPDKLWGAFAAYAIFKPPSGALSLVGGLGKALLLYEMGLFPPEHKRACRVYKEQFKPPQNAKSSKRLVRQTPFWAAGNVYKEPKMGKRDTTDFYRFIQDTLGKSWGPEGRNIGVRMVCGGWDPLGQDQVINQWKHNLPQLKGHVRRFDEVGHFIEEVKPKEIADALVDVASL